MRIVAGAWRGRAIVAPVGQATRPTSDRAREGLFSMLLSRIGTFEGLRVADMFAGSGALGLEALSRGAAHCTFVDKDREAVAAIRRNVGAFGADDRADIRAVPIEHLPPATRPCSLVFIDPPYGSALVAAALPALIACNWLEPGGLVSVESDVDTPSAIPGFERMAERKFGKAHIALLRRVQ